MGLAKKQQLKIERDLETSKREPIKAQQPRYMTLQEIEEQEIANRQSNTVSPPPGNQRSRNQGRQAGETLKSNLNVLSQISKRNRSAKARKEQAEKTMQERLQAEREAAFISKFVKDYEQVLADMQNQDGYEPDELLTFEQAGSILCTLGFLPENVTPAKPDYKLFEELWDLMEGNERKGVQPNDF